MAVHATPHVSVVARSARVRGRLTGDGDLEIRGFVEGEVAVGGEVTVEAEGLVSASVHGRRVVVRGAVKGDLVGDESIVIESGGRVVGDLKAPRITLADGALVRGLVQTGDAEGGAPSQTVRATAARPVSTAAHRPAPAARVVASVPRAAATRAATKVEAPAPAVETAHRAPTPLRRPPPPVVPALKKMRGQIVKKKER
jgi:cytoskeletal protein CcmA (bactofilin family)